MGLVTGLAASIVTSTGEATDSGLGGGGGLGLGLGLVLGLG